ncbi:MAG: lactoylglutathione lyase [Clostridiales bacterium]|jgi:lactoylglutathione lyase|nr:lactoylglutathione lyase [Clostridiales bacterium]
MFKFNHFNFNVVDLEKSIKFYKEALGFEPVREINGEGFKLVFLGDGTQNFQLELTWLEDHPQPYDLGEVEFHLAVTADDMEAARKKHEEMGCICYVNDRMGIYFIEDPDGYWIEIVPKR